MFGNKVINVKKWQTECVIELSKFGIRFFLTLLVV